MQDITDIPDFSGDDFATDRQIQKLRSEAKAHQTMVNDSLAILQEKFGMINASHKNLKGYDIIKSLGATVIYSLSSVIANRKLYTSLVTYFSSYPVVRGSNSGSDQYLVGFLECQANYPRTYIHKESVREKLVDLVLKHDVDFPYSKRFSRKFQVVTEDKKRLKDLLELSDLNSLGEFSNMEVELYGHGLVFRNSRKPISIKETNEFVRLIENLLKAFK